MKNEPEEAPEDEAERLFFRWKQEVSKYRRMNQERSCQGEQLLFRGHNR
jgi:hypothetical protein